MFRTPVLLPFSGKEHIKCRTPLNQDILSHCVQNDMRFLTGGGTEPASEAKGTP